MENILNESFGLANPMKFMVSAGRNQKNAYIVKLLVGRGKDSKLLYRFNNIPNKENADDILSDKQEQEQFSNGTLTDSPKWRKMSRVYFASYMPHGTFFYWNLSELCQNEPVENPTTQCLPQAIQKIRQLQAENPEKSKVDIIFDNFIGPCVKELNKEANFPRAFDDTRINAIKSEVPEVDEILSIVKDDVKALKTLSNSVPVSMDDVDELLNELSELTSSEEYAQKLNELYKWAEDIGINEYSLNNILLIKIQKENATRVWPACDWKNNANRKPKDGATPIWLLTRIGETGENNRETANAKLNSMGVQYGEYAIADHIHDKILRTKVGDKKYKWQPFYDWSDTEVIPGKEDRLPNPTPGGNIKDTSNETMEAARYYNIVVSLLKDAGIIDENEAAKLNRTGQNMFQNNINANGNLANISDNQDSNNIITRNLGAVKSLIKRYAEKVIEDEYKGDDGIESKRYQNNIRFIGMQAEICAWTTMRMLGFTNMPNEMESLASSGIDNQYIHATFNTLASIAHNIAMTILYYDNESNAGNTASAGNNQSQQSPNDLGQTYDDDMLEESISGRDLAMICGKIREYDKVLNENIITNKNIFFDILDRINLH